MVQACEYNSTLITVNQTKLIKGIKHGVCSEAVTLQLQYYDHQERRVNKLMKNTVESLLVATPEEQPTSL